MTFCSLPHFGCPFLRGNLVSFLPKVMASRVADKLEGGGSLHRCWKRSNALDDILGGAPPSYLKSCSAT